MNDKTPSTRPSTDPWVDRAEKLYQIIRWTFKLGGYLILAATMVACLVLVAYSQMAIHPKGDRLALLVTGITIFVLAAIMTYVGPWSNLVRIHKIKRAYAHYEQNRDRVTP